MTLTEPGEIITDDIIQLVTQRAKEHGLSLDAEPVLRGIGSAFVAWAYTVHAQEAARTMLLNLVAALDDPPTREWVKTHGQPN